jgi:pre-mRNA-processing factor 6
MKKHFGDLKHSLASVSKEEWESIPDPVIVRRAKEKKKHLMPTPDNIISQIRGGGETSQAMDPLDGMQSSLAQLGQAKTHALGIMLDNQQESLQISSKVNGFSTVNKDGYMTEL